MGRAYLDWAAGAPPLKEATLAAQAAMGTGNPSSVHAEGRAARATLEHARGQVAALAGCAPRDVVFTASGTEANAAAILGALDPGHAGAVILCGLEHPSVHLAAQVAQGRGARVQAVAALPSGIADPAAFRAALSAGPAALVAIQAVNHETGAIQPVVEIAAAAREAGARVHVDAVQAAGKLDLADLAARADTLSISAHKLGGLPGAGALVTRVELAPSVPGHQERGRRGGTHALSAIAAFGVAAERALLEREARAAALREHTGRIEALVRELGGVVNAAGVPRAGGIVSATFPGADGETLLVALDLAGVAASHGAACASGAVEPSAVLLAMGLPREHVRATVRFSVGHGTTEEELELLEAALPPALAAARS